MRVAPLGDITPTHVMHVMGARRANHGTRRELVADRGGNREGTLVVVTVAAESRSVTGG
jgi:hypothetical protein